VLGRANRAEGAEGGPEAMGVMALKGYAEWALAGGRCCGRLLSRDECG
jgi:hypothetical protein